MSVYPPGRRDLSLRRVRNTFTGPQSGADVLAGNSCPVGRQCLAHQPGTVNERSGADILARNYWSLDSTTCHLCRRDGRHLRQADGLGGEVPAKLLGERAALILRPAERRGTSVLQINGG